MKSFFGGTYIGKEVLAENNIFHPIRLEYYRIEKLDKNQTFYGIEIVKTEYKKEGIKVENKVIENVTKEEKKINSILEKLKVGTVTPQSGEDIVTELIGA